MYPSTDIEGAKDGNAYIWKKIGKLECVNPPWKVTREEEKKDDTLKVIYDWAGTKVQGMVTEDRIVDGKVVYLLDHQKATIRSLKGADLGYQVLQKLKYMFYKKGDQQVQITFEEKLNVALKDLRKAKQDASQYLNDVWTCRKRIRAVHEQGDKYLSDADLVGRVLFHLKKVPCYKILVNNMRVWNDMADGEDKRLGWSKLHECMLAEQRDNEAEEKEVEKEVEPSVQPSAQVGSFQAMQQREEARHSDDERDDRRDRGYGRRRNYEDRRYFDRRGNRDYDDRRDSDRRGNRRNRGGGGKRECYCCGSEDHIARKCPKRYGAKEGEGQDS